MIHSILVTIAVMAGPKIVPLEIIDIMAKYLKYEKFSKIFETISSS